MTHSHHPVAPTHDRRHADAQALAQDPVRLHPRRAADWPPSSAVRPTPPPARICGYSSCTWSNRASRPVSLNVTITGLKFFFDVTLDHAELMARMHPVPVPRKLPLVLSRDEVARLIASAGSLKYQAALSVAYGAGLRASEVVALKVTDIDSGRMALRVEQGKGHKDRYAMLSPALLERLRAWWQSARAEGKILHGGWLFPGLNPVDPLSTRQLNRAIHAAAEAGADRQARLHAHAAPQFRHPSAGAEGRYPRDPGPARAQAARDHRAVCPGGHRNPARGDQSARARCSPRRAAVMERPALEVADIFRAHGPAWRQAQHGHLSLGQLKVMSAIEQCRSAALGGHVLRCDACEHTEIAYNSCRNRHCPKCQASAARRWLEARQNDLLPVEYYHVVFTLPAPIAALAWYNKAVIYRLLFEVAAETLCTIAADPKHLGARIGATLVLHTWGSALTHHPHVHGIVPGGGLSPDGERWVACRPGFFLPVRVLSRLFRRRFLEATGQAHTAPASCASSANMRALADATAFAAGWRRCDIANGWSMPSARLPGPRRCWPTCRATPTAWRSPTAAWSPWTSAASRFAGRTTAPRAICTRR